MKKLYQGKGRRVHPAPPAADAGAAAALALPAAVLTLAAALTAEEQEVLAYLLSGGGGAVGGGGRRRRHGPHPPEMGCGCFGCYKSFWARWDASPNRHLIHRIIDAVEEDGGGGGGGGGGAGTPRRHHRRRRRGRGGRERGAAAGDAAEADAGVEHHQGCAFDDGVEDGDYEGDEDDGEEEADSIYGDESEEMMMDGSDCSNVGAGAGNAEKSTVGRLVRFIGEKVWGAWN